MKIDWLNFAKCKGANTHLFFPPTKDLHGMHIKAINELPHIKSVIDTYCENCPVKDACLSEAINIKAFNQIRGGTYVHDRFVRRLRKKLASNSADS